MTMTWEETGVPGKQADRQELLVAYCRWTLHCAGRQKSNGNWSNVQLPEGFPTDFTFGKPTKNSSVEHMIGRHCNCHNDKAVAKYPNHDITVGTLQWPKL